MIVGAITALCFFEVGSLLIPSHARACEGHTIIRPSPAAYPELVYKERRPQQTVQTDEHGVRFLTTEYIHVVRYPHIVNEQWCNGVAAELLRSPDSSDPYRVVGRLSLDNPHICELTTTFSTTRIP